MELLIIVQVLQLCKQYQLDTTAVFLIIIMLITSMVILASPTIWKKKKITTVMNLMIRIICFVAIWTLNSIMKIFFITYSLLSKRYRLPCRCTKKNSTIKISCIKIYSELTNLETLCLKIINSKLFRRKINCIKLLT